MTSKRDAIRSSKRGSRSNPRGAKTQISGLIEEERDASRNTIPVGRQLYRTPPARPPVRTVKEEPDSEPDSPPAAVIKQEADTQPETDVAGDWQSTAGREDTKPARRSSATSAKAKMLDADPDELVEGMDGYEWTEADLAFVNRLKREKHVQQLQGEVADLLKRLERALQLKEWSFAARDQIQTELSKVPSGEQMLQYATGFLLRTRGSSEVGGLGARAVLAQIKTPDVQQALGEEGQEVSRLERKLVTARKKREQLEERTAQRGRQEAARANISALREGLAELRCQQPAAQEPLKASRGRPRAPKVQRDLNPPAADAGELRRSKRIAQKNIASNKGAAPKKTTSRK